MVRRTASLIGWIGLLGLALTPAVWSAGKAYEGQLFPVTSVATITSIQAVEGGSIIRLEFDKYRNCTFIGLSWYIGDEGERFERARINFEIDGADDSGSTRPTGRQAAGPWFISLTPDEIRNHSFAEAKHECHPLWETTTVFYP